MVPDSRDFRCIGEFYKTAGERWNRPVLPVLPPVDGAEGHLEFTGELLLRYLSGLTDFANQA